MEALLGLLLMLAGMSHGIETSCDATQDGAQCYGALGGTVYLQLMTNASGRHLVVNKPDRNQTRSEILRVKNNQVGKTPPRLTFYVNNGTLRITNTERNDSAEYLVELFNQGGILTESRKLQLSIEVPVSSPQLSSDCLSQGETRVSCSTEGDDPQYSWTLDGHTLSDSVVLSGKETNNITLKRGSSGNLTCTVKNNVSSVAAHLKISPCTGFKYINCTLPNGTEISDWVNATGNTLCLKPTTIAPSTQTTTAPNNQATIGKGTTTSRPSNHTNQALTTNNDPNNPSGDFIRVLVGSLVAVVLVLGAIVVIFYLRKRKKPAIASDDAEDVTYADVRFVNTGRGVPKKKEAPAEVEYGQVRVAGSRRLQPSQAMSAEVEYGEVRIVPRPGKKVTPEVKPEEDCVYSSVRRGQ